MNLSVFKVLLLLVFSINIAYAVSCENTHSCHNYGLVKLIQKSAEHINVSKSLKLISPKSIEFINGFEKTFPVFVRSLLLDSLSETASYKCIEDLKYVYESVRSPGGWAMKMLDAYGKPGSGILLGNIRWLGEYDECLAIQAPPKQNTSVGNFRGKYCTLQLPLNLDSMPLPLSTALCLPDSCHPNGTIFSILQNHTFNGNGSLGDIDEKIESILEKATLTCKPTSRKMSTGAIIVICLLSVFALLAAIGSTVTVVEYYMQKGVPKECECRRDFPAKVVNKADAENASQEVTDDALLLGTEKQTVLPAWLEKCKPFFNCFCIFTNGEKILNTAGSEGQLPCLHGIRFLSMTWVIICHSYESVYSIVKNSEDAVNVIDHWPFQIILNGFFSVDSFFLLSGFLVGYLFFQQAQKTDGKIPWLYFYIHRYVRLTPVYMIVIAFYTTISPLLGSGPLWPDYDIIQECKEKWWWNALYINNFVSKEEKQCMPWAWYLANDMQFYVISPLFLITLWRWPRVGYSLLGLFFSITFVSNFVLTYEYNLLVGMGNVVEYIKDMQHFTLKLNDYSNYIYFKPYTRIGPYLVGLALAYYLYKRKISNSPSLNLIILSLGWIIASAVALTCQFALYHQVFSNVGASFYNSLSRLGFAMGLAWVIFVCVIGQGGVVNSILSWKAMIPLSRLTYCAYLVHPIVLTTYTSSVRTFINFNQINAIMLYLGFLLISYAVAMVTSLLLESPVIRLERLIRNKFAS